MQTMCGLDDKGGEIVYERLIDCQHTSDMHTQALMFLRLFMLGGWRINVVKPLVSHKIFFGMLPPPGTPMGNPTVHSIVTRNNGATRA